jgi:DNA-binding MarR family transcriptional regulator
LSRGTTKSSGEVSSQLPRRAWDEKDGLATATGLTRGAVSNLIERLVQKDLVSRAEATDDRRFQDVRLTSAGWILVPKLAAIADQNDNEFFSQLPLGERERLVATLKKLVAVNNLNKVPTT